MAVDIVEGVRERQRELDGIDQSLANFVQRSENPGEKPFIRVNIRKEMVASSKRRLELKNAINRDMQDSSLHEKANLRKKKKLFPLQKFHPLELLTELYCIT